MKMTFMLLCFVILLVAGQFIVASLPLPAAEVNLVDVVRERRPDGSATGMRVAEVHYSIKSGSFELPVRVVATSGTSPWKGQDLYVYYDSNADFEHYGSPVPRSAIVAGLVEDLRAEARLRNLKGNVSLIGPEKLSQVWSQNGVVLVVPTKVWNWDLDPVPDRLGLKEWVRRGGTLVIVGKDRLLGELIRGNELGTPLNVRAVGSWRQGDSNGSGKASLLYVGNDQTILSWSYRTTSVAGDGAWITHQPDKPLNLRGEQNKVYLRFQVRISSGQSLELLYVDLRDAKGNFRHYYVDPRVLRAGFVWREILLPLDDADWTSEEPADLHQVTSLSFVVKLKSHAYTNKYMEVDLGGVRLERGPNAKRVGPLWSLLQFQCGEVASYSRPLSKSQGSADSERDGRTQGNSFSVYRLGRGVVLQFGEGVTPVCTESQVAHDLMQVIQAGALLSDVRVAYADYDIPPSAEVKGQLRVPFQRDPVSVLFFSRNPYHLYYLLHEQRSPEAH